MRRGLGPGDDDECAVTRTQETKTKLLTRTHSYYSRKEHARTGKRQAERTDDPREREREERGSEDGKSRRRRPQIGGTWSLRLQGISVPLGHRVNKAHSFLDCCNFVSLILVMVEWSLVEAVSVDEFDVFCPRLVGVFGSAACYGPEAFAGVFGDFGRGLELSCFFFFWSCLYTSE